MGAVASSYPGVIWITGLSGAGKSTLAHEVVARLRKSGRSVILLDGDDLREVFGATSNKTDHGREKRLSLAMQYAHLSRIISAQGVLVVIATISMFHEVHTWNRTNLPGYFEVYLKVPIEELRRRDPKGIYRRFDAGELTNVAGLDLTVDEPQAPDWTVPFISGCGAETLADELIHFFETKDQA